MQGLKDVIATYNGALEDALESGDCLDALKVPDSDVKAVDASLDRLPEAMQEVRAGDAGVANEIRTLKFGDGRDATPCKP